MTDERNTPAPNPNATPATGQHGPTCPPRSDGDGGSRSCTWFDHDKGFAADQAAEDEQAMVDAWKIS